MTSPSHQWLEIPPSEDGFCPDDRNDLRASTAAPEGDRVAPLHVAGQTVLQSTKTRILQWPTTNGEVILTFLSELTGSEIEEFESLFAIVLSVMRRRQDAATQGQSHD